ncbi:MAG: PilZ domain-containing protein [Spirochaetes bacterium]|nr:PilZ domain-containing protein [Spirochaetota bacterium]
MAKEHRRFPRFSINRIVEIGIMRSDTFSAEGINISEGGVLCESTYPVEPLAKVTVMFTIETAGKDHTIECDGSVAHVKRKGKKYLFGIHFADIDPDDQKLIRDTFK